MRVAAMQSIVVIFSLLLLKSNNAFNQDDEWLSAKKVYQFSATNIQGNDTSLRKYKEELLIVVNVASLCRLTDTNYKQLQMLYMKYRNKGLRIAGFPSGDFKNQEYNTSKEIINFVKKYNVTFDMYEKVHVNGPGAHPLWKWLTTKYGGSIKDNFSKFLVSKKGNVIARYAPEAEPKSMEDNIKLYLCCM